MADWTGLRSAPSAVRHADQVRTLFDGKSAGWPGKYAADGRLAGRLRRLAAAVAGLAESGGDVLDLGCGSGELARHLAAAGYQVTGCDIAPLMLRQATVADHASAGSSLTPGGEYCRSRRAALTR
jgi:2-polyprenyl-3-methyl-5-hydroxy-6-metoxy-1,4-benzoquinol methylase